MSNQNSAHAEHVDEKQRWEAELQSGQRFAFGSNWSSFLARCSEEQKRAAKESLVRWLGNDFTAQPLFLDIGCGSGLFSAAAYELGATVYSIDYDLDSVACTQQLRAQSGAAAERWTVEHGSILDTRLTARVPKAQIVYSWGVLHHTGALWKACDAAASFVAPNGRLWIALYNDQRWVSRYWLAVKRFYNSGWVGKSVMTALHAPYLLGLRWISALIKGADSSTKARGMNLWNDMHDWLGGLPFEVAKPEAVLEFFQARGFMLTKLKTCGGRHGCNEYLFERVV